MGSVENAKDRHSGVTEAGYVRDFALAADGFAMSAAELRGLDPLFHWLLHASRQALNDAGLDKRDRTGAVIGNLSFPSAGMAHFAERTWLGKELADAAGGTDRGSSESVHVRTAPPTSWRKPSALGRASFCLDAACASSLVAIKLACDRLHRREADSMLAGGVCCADDLFIHVGFCALKAMSETSASRPFHRNADGLVPARRRWHRRPRTAF